MASETKMKYDVEENLRIFRERLRQSIDARGYTYADVEFYTGIAAPTISRYLAALRLPDTRYLLVLCKFFNVSADWILGVSDTKKDEELPEVAALYNKATPDDRAVIDMILKKYK